MDNPDEVVKIEVDQTSLPPGEYINVGYETRQVFNIVIRRWVTGLMGGSAAGYFFTSEYPFAPYFDLTAAYPMGARQIICAD